MYILFLLFLSFLNLLFALRTNQYFSIDDFAVLAFLKDYQLINMFPSFLISGDLFGFKKILGYVVFGILFKSFSVNAVIFNISLFTIHSINLVLLYLSSLKLTTKKFSAFFVSVIFNSFYLFYFSNIHEYLLVLFSLLTIYTYISFPKKKFLYFTSFALALVSKETAIFVPLILLSISYFRKMKRKNIYAMLAISAVVGMYQLASFKTSSTISLNTSYTTISGVGSLVSNFFNLLDPRLFVFLILLPLITKEYKYYPLLLSAFCILLPASLLTNRGEVYYLYFPISIILLYISLFITKFNLKSVVLTIVTVILFGGRSILPPIAWRQFPNWQKESIKKVLEESEAGKKDFSDINLERDARLMIESGTTDLFLKYKKEHGL